MKRGLAPRRSEAGPVWGQASRGLGCHLTKCFASVTMLQPGPLTHRVRRASGLFVSTITIAASRISLFRQVTHQFKELLVFLADEESIRHETITSGHGAGI